MGEKCSDRLRLEYDFHVILEIIYMQICDMGQTALLPSEGRRAEDFFALKNPTASVGFEPANLGTKGQHATSRPPKPIKMNITMFLNHIVYNVYIIMSSAFSFKSCFRTLLDSSLCDMRKVT